MASGKGNRYLAVVFMLTVAATWRGVASANHATVTLGGVERRIWTRPHKPFDSIGTIAQLRERFAFARPYLPPMPFKMEGKWIIPAADGTFRISEVAGVFSPNGDYVVQVEPRRDGVHEFPPNSRRIKLFTHDGKLLWEKEWGPTYAIVTDDGHVVGDNRGTMQQMALIIYDRKGNEVKPWFQMFLAEFEVRDFAIPQLIPEAKLFLARTQGHLAAMTYEGDELWRFSAGSALEVIGQPGLDPLGRGIFVPTYARAGTSIRLLNPRTGAEVGTVWQHKPLSPLVRFSPSGRYAGVAVGPVSIKDQVRIMDWRTGELLFDTMQTKLDITERPDDLKIAYWNRASVSDDPPRLVIEMQRTVGVYDKSGQRIWWCDIEPNSGGPPGRDPNDPIQRTRYTSPAKYTLSSDGQILGIAFTRPDTSVPHPNATEFTGLVSYRIP